MAIIRRGHSKPLKNIWYSGEEAWMRINYYGNIGCILCGKGPPALQPSSRPKHFARHLKSEAHIARFMAVFRIGDT